MITIEFGKDGGDIHTIKPFAWIEWPTIFIENRWNDLKLFVHGIKGGRACITTQYYSPIYSRRKYESTEDRDARIAREKQEYEDQAPEREAFLRSIKRRTPLDDSKD